VSAGAALAAATAKPVAESRRTPPPSTAGPLKQLGRKVEAWVRQRIRAPFRRWLALRGSRRQVEAAPGTPAPVFEPGSVVMFPGELRHDYRALMLLKRSLSLDFVFMFYDLHGYLPAGDPRLDDPDAVDVHGTDFFLREGALILSISRFSAGELQKVVSARGRPAPPVIPIRLAGSLAPAHLDRPVASLEPGRFVLCVGDVCHRKNHAFLGEVWRRLAGQVGAAALPLICVGRITREFAAVAAGLEADPVLRGLLRIEPNLDDEQLAWLYRNCRFTVFASLSEGFGLPVAESLGHGKVCVASTATSIPEAGQGAAIGLDPRDAEAWTGVVGRLMCDDDWLAAKQAEIATRFRSVAWSDTVADIRAALAAHGLADGGRA